MKALILLFLFVTGAGAVSLDAWLAKRIDRPTKNDPVMHLLIAFLLTVLASVSAQAYKIRLESQISLSRMTLFPRYRPLTFAFVRPA